MAVFIAHNERADRALTFMYQGFVESARSALAHLRADHSPPTRVDASRLVRGDVLVFVGCIGPVPNFADLRRRGVRCVHYWTEPNRAPAYGADEVWYYSKHLSTLHPGSRFVHIHPQANARRVRYTAPPSRLVFLGSLQYRSPETRRVLRAIPEFVEVYDAWNDASYERVLHDAPAIYLSCNKTGTSALPSARINKLLSHGALVISEHCNPVDDALYSGLVTFCTLVQVDAVFRGLMMRPPAELTEMATQTYIEFRRRFGAASIPLPPPPAPPRTAVLVTGQLRGTDAQLRALRDRLAGAVVYVATYEAYRPQLAALGVPSERALLVGDVETTDMGGANGAKQWLLLQALVATHEAALARFELVVRTRTDLTLTPAFALPASAKPNTMHAISDNYFYARADHFLSVTRTIYADFVARRYYRMDAEGRAILPHWRHLRASAFEAQPASPYPTRWYMLLFPRADFGGAKPHDLADMLARLRAVDLDRAPYDGSEVAYADCARLHRPGLRMARSGFDSEAAFLMECLRRGPVDLTGVEQACYLRRRA